MASPAKLRIEASRGNALLRHVASVDPRVAEGLKRDATAPASQHELEQLLDEEKRRAITDPYQSFLYDVRAMHKKGNFRGTQGDAILQRIRDLGEKSETTLDLGGFSVRDDFALLMVDFLRSKSSRLTALSVADTQIGIDGATAIARAANATLETLQFSQHALALAVFRRDAQTTRHAVLAGKAYNHLDAAAIGVLVERESRKLERLDVSQNLLTGARANVFQGVAILLRGLTKCPRLRDLNLSSVDLRAEGLTTLATTVVALAALEKLDLRGNRLCCNSYGDRNLAGFEAFCNALWQVRKLKELTLAQNELDYVACTAIATMLTVNQRLRRLDLSSNPVAEAGAVQLAVGVKKNAILEELVLMDCKLTCEAVEAIAEATRKFNRTLQSLVLRDNPAIRSHGFKHLVKCLSVNPAIRVVDVNAPPKYDAFVAKMQALLAVNSSLVALRRDFQRFEFESLSDVQRTNFIEKLNELSERELQRLYAMNVVEDIEIGSLEGFDAAVSSLRYYSEMQQYAPLRRLLWVLESGARQDAMDKRPTRQEPTSPSQKPPRRNRRRSNNGGDARGGKQRGDEAEEEEGEDEDIWDYPIC